MIIINYELDVPTKKEDEMIDITDLVSKLLTKSQVKNGMIHLFVAHTTAAVTINENADPSVKTDILFSLRRNFPIEKEYLHFEGNSHAHIKSSVMGNTQSLIVKDGHLKLGPWQGIYFCEFDGPRKRQIFMQIMGE